MTPSIEFAPTRPGDQTRTIADTSSAADVLGWQPSVLPAEGLRRQAEWVAGLRR